MDIERSVEEPGRDEKIKAVRAKIDGSASHISTAKSFRSPER
ncbi:hypothetical protein CSE45_2434 [Citreicella sp. SE45]|uniref:Uncharacterized protein n=1 Tax=Salipiger thiooxidans TaxID=282683 RepID=A0A1G7DDR7_9RHOB|nr:hypothetical protein [Salipiger thiooxidans]EEX14853.1 hypothetical protein CSE45_2434 [Citreicella sp. SE45]SDE49126.1 hypothetical protein SAMN04488105_104129 [Salipiger thiooxidans]